jgi:hypothetical protein
MERMGRLFPAIIQIREDIRAVRDIRCAEEGGNWHCVVWKRMVGNNALIGGLHSLVYCLFLGPCGEGWRLKCGSCIFFCGGRDELS